VEAWARKEGEGFLWEALGASIACSSRRRARRPPRHRTTWLASASMAVQVFQSSQGVSAYAMSYRTHVFRIRYELPHKTYEKPHKREMVPGACF